MSGECECTAGSLVGAVLGTFFSTLLLCLLIAIVVFLKCGDAMLGRRSRVKGSPNIADSRKNDESSYTSPTFTSESTTYEQSNTLPIREPATDYRSDYGNGRGRTANSLEDSDLRNPKFCSTAKAGAQYNVREDFMTTRDSVQSAVFHRSLPEAPSMMSTAASSPYLQEPESVDLFFNGQHPLGLGFTIHGNMSRGVFVETVSDQGPAAYVLQIGDQITRLTLFMDHVVFEDALKIFGCISIYPIQLRLKRPRIPAAAAAESGSSTGADGERIPPWHPSKFLRQSLGDINDWFTRSSDSESRAQSRPTRTTIDLGSFESETPVTRTSEKKQQSEVLEIERTDVIQAPVVRTTEKSQQSAIQEREVTQSSSQNAPGKESLTKGDEIEENTVITVVARDNRTDENKSETILNVDDGLEGSKRRQHPVEIAHSSSPEVPKQSLVAVVSPLSEVIAKCREEEERGKEQMLLQKRTAKAGVAYFVSMHDHFGVLPA